MADNVAITAGTGTTIAADDVGGALHQRVKATWGPDGTGNDIDVATGKPLPVQIRSANGLIPGGEPTDAAATATDTTSVSWTSLLKQISKSIQLMVFGAGTAAAAQRTTLASDDPAVATLGATADAAVTAGATGSLSAKLRSLSRDLITRAASLWVAGSGVGLTWTAAITGTTLNSLTSTQALLSDVDITNGTALDKYMDVSVHLASAAFTGTGINVSIHIYPLNDDATTYGDGKFGSAAAGPVAYPPAGVIPLVALTQAQNGTAVGIVIPPGTFRLVICNNGGVNWASSGNTVKYRTYN